MSDLGQFIEQRARDLCGKPFMLRTGGGSSPRRFWCTRCRLPFHAKVQPGQRVALCGALPTLAVTKCPTRDDAFSVFAFMPQQDAISIYCDPNGDIYCDGDPILKAGRCHDRDPARLCGSIRRTARGSAGVNLDAQLEPEGFAEFWSIYSRHVGDWNVSDQPYDWLAADAEDHLDQAGVDPCIQTAVLGGPTAEKKDADRRWKHAVDWVVIRTPRHPSVPGR
jgi:hypothetical protein